MLALLLFDVVFSSLIPSFDSWALGLYACYRSPEDVLRYVMQCNLSLTSVSVVSSSTVDLLDVFNGPSCALSAFPLARPLT